jgi:serine-threonine kinase receptor-associated protein
MSSVAVAPIVCPGHSRPVPDISFSKLTPDGYFLASACLDGKAMMREGVTGDWIGTFLGHKGAVSSCRLNAEATKAVTASFDFSAKVWNACTGDALQSFQHKHLVKTAIFSTDSSSIFTGGKEKLLRMFDLGRPDAKPTMFHGHNESICYLATTPDSNILISSADEKNIRIWDIRTQQTVKQLVTTAPVSSLQVSGDEKVLAASADKDVYFWDTASLELIKSVRMPHTVDCVAYSTVKNQFITGCEEELWIRIYNFDTEEEIGLKKGHHGPVRCLAFAPGADRFASGSVDGTIRLWQC